MEYDDHSGTHLERTEAVGGPRVGSAGRRRPRRWTEGQWAGEPRMDPAAVHEEGGDRGNVNATLCCPLCAKQWHAVNSASLTTHPS